MSTDESQEKLKTSRRRFLVRASWAAPAVIATAAVKARAAQATCPPSICGGDDGGGGDFFF